MRTGGQWHVIGFGLAVAACAMLAVAAAEEADDAPVTAPAASPTAPADPFDLATTGLINYDARVAMTLPRVAMPPLVDDPILLLPQWHHVSLRVQREPQSPLLSVDDNPALSALHLGLKVPM